MKKIIALVMALVMVFALVACGAKTAPAAAAPAAAAPAAAADAAPAAAELPEVKWICAHGYPNTSDEQEYLMWIANPISAKAGGKHRDKNRSGTSESGSRGYYGVHDHHRNHHE